MFSQLASELIGAFGLLFGFDAELWNILATTLKVAGMSTYLSCMIALPLGVWFGLSEFRGRKVVDALLNTLLGLPTVAVGLLVYLFISRQGPLGGLELLFTRKAIILGQIILATPIITVMVANAVRSADPRIIPTALTLGATPRQARRMLLYEVRNYTLLAIVAGFGRVIAEVGSAMMVGGNIHGKTRTITTGIALLTSQGEFAKALALGIVLVGIIFAINLTLYWVTHREGR